MAKNIVLCCDGTANEFAKDNTNVVKLYATLQQDSASQVTYYHPGLGTMEPAGALTPVRRRTTKMLGMAMGYGLANDVRDAYVFLMNHFQPDDKVFLFGFSRGAYTARAVASLLHMYGLLRPGNEPLVPYAIRMMTGIERGRDQHDDRYKQQIDDYFTLAHDFKTAMSRECKPWFVGVWDTVSSVGWVANPLKLPYIATNPDIAIGRHAIAIDERRAFFRSHLWRPAAEESKAGPKDLKQVWFPGVHCDVGGGYPEIESGLSKLALQWMLDEAEQAGLLVHAQKKREILGDPPGGRYAAPDGLAPMHESLKGWWHLAEFVLKKHFDYKTRKERRRINFYRPRTVPDGSLVHPAVFQRGPEYRNKLPPDITPI